MNAPMAFHSNQAAAHEPGDVAAGGLGRDACAICELARGSRPSIQKRRQHARAAGIGDNRRNLGKASYGGNRRGSHLVRHYLSGGDPDILSELIVR